MIVENAGFGAAAAAPIARRVFDFLLAGQWPNDEDMAATREGRSVAPMGVPRRAADVTMEQLGLPALVPVAALAVPLPLPVPVAASTAPVSVVATAPAATAKVNAARLAPRRLP